MKKGASESLIKSSVKGSFNLIKKNKLSFGFSLITHLAFLIVIGILFTYYFTQIGASAQQALAPLNEVSGEIEPMDLSGLMENSETIQFAYSQMAFNLYKFMMFTFLAYIFLGGLNWNIANLIVNEDPSYIMFQLMFGVSTAIFGVVVFLFTTIFSSILNFVNYQLSLVLTFIGILFLLYFTQISFSLIHRRDINPMRTLIKTALQFGWKKKKTLLFSFSLVTLLTAFFVVLTISLVDAPIRLLMLSLIPLILVLSWGKIFFMLTVKKELEKPQ